MCSLSGQLGIFHGALLHDDTDLISVGGSARLGEGTEAGHLGAECGVSEIIFESSWSRQPRILTPFGRELRSRRLALTAAEGTPQGTGQASAGVIGHLIGGGCPLEDSTTLREKILGIGEKPVLRVAGISLAARLVVSATCMLSYISGSPANVADLFLVMTGKFINHLFACGSSLVRFHIRLFVPQFVSKAPVIVSVLMTVALTVYRSDSCSNVTCNR